MARSYRLSDTAQQIVGGFLLAGPFVVTEEVWILASTMTWIHTVFAAAIVAAIGYGALYEADPDRDPDEESEVGGVPLRFLSLMGVSFGSVSILAIVLAAPQTFLIEGAVLAEPTTVEIAATSVKAATVGAIFSVVGAATADSIF